MRGLGLRVDVGRAGADAVISALFAGLCDDAALFPPGNAPLPDALPAHAGHLSAPYADLVGPFVFPVARLGELTPGALELSLTLPGGPATLEPALDRLAQIDGATAVALEIAVPADQTAAEFFAAMDAVEALTAGLDVFVEVPRGERRPDFLAALTGGPFAAKFRTGGVVAEAYPDETELAAALHTVIASGIPFKATAGLHHAVRHFDPTLGVDRHGFLNLLLAVCEVVDQRDPAPVLRSTDVGHLVRLARAVSEETAKRARALLVSYGSCSTSAPLDDLRALGLIEEDA